MSGTTGLELMLSLVRSLPDQLAGAADRVAAAGLRRPPAPPREVLLCGMGGSAAPGDVLAPTLAAAGVRLTLHRDYGLPFWADGGTLVVASSYSGQTEETLAATTAALARGCPLLAITSGGRLGELAAGAGVGSITLPGGLPPRAALGHGLGALIWGLHAVGLLPDPGPQVAEAVEVLRRGNELHDGGAGDPAVELARRCQGRFLAIHAAGAAAGGAARRLKAQVNENAKLPACWAEFPELDHNELVGWELPPGRRRDFALLVLEGGEADPRLAARVEATLALLQEQFGSVTRIAARGAGPLARAVSLVQFGDHLSCRLAEAAGVDPIPVTRIESLKARLREGEGR